MTDYVMSVFFPPTRLRPRLVKVMG